MATGAYVGVSSSSKKIKNIYLGVGNVAKKVKKAYIGVGGISRLWWVSKLSFSKTIPFPNATNNVDTTSNGFYFQNNGSYIIASGIRSFYHVNANDVVGNVSLSHSISEFGLMGSSGTKVWYMNYKRGDETDGFHYVDQNLVESNRITNFITIDYNWNYGGGSRSFKHLGVAAFFHFQYPKHDVVCANENGLVYNMKDVLSNVSGGSYKSYAKVYNYLVFTATGAVNVSTGVVQSIGTQLSYMCGKAADINGKTIVACGSPANSKTKVYAIYNNLVCNELTVPSELSSLPCVSYECVPYDNKFYFYSGSSSYKSFSVDLNHMFEIVESPTTLNSEFYDALGYDVFNNNLYLGLGSHMRLTGLLKGS